MKLFLCAALLPGLCLASILPDGIGPYHRGTVSQPTLADRPIWDEYGLKNSETSVYENGKSKFTASAYQLQDTTGALAAFDWQRPEKSRPSTLAALAAETKDSLLLVHGNYLFLFDGYKPSQPELDALVGGLNQVDGTSLPTLPGHLPEADRTANSERYILGPASLQKFVPAIPPSVAGFRLGAEGQYGVFHNAKGDTAITIFEYPTPQIAMQRFQEFEKLPNTMVRRSGPFVTVAVSPADPDLAERLLGQVRYLADVTVKEYVPTLKDNIGNLVINAFVLIGILLIFITVGGLGVGLWRIWLRRGDRDPDAGTLITLHLE
jgi:hypothetical protein